MSWAMAVGATISIASGAIKNKQAKSAQDKARRNARKAQNELDEQKDSCLLYTSDAADE